MPNNFVVFFEEKTKWVDEGSPVDVIYLDFQKHLIKFHIKHRRSQDFCLGGGAPGNFFFLTMFWQHSQYDSRLGFEF